MFGFGRGKADVYEEPIPEKGLEPYVLVKRLSKRRWSVTAYRGKDDNSVRYMTEDPIKDLRGYYIFRNEEKAEKYAKILLSRVKDQIDWARTVKRFDVK